MVTPDTQPNSPVQPATPTKAGRKHDRIQQRCQAAALQRFAYDAAMALRNSCTEPDSGKLTIDAKAAASIHKLVGAWDLAADRLRVLRGKGLPASVRFKAKVLAQPEPLGPA